MSEEEIFDSELDSMTFNPKLASIVWRSLKKREDNGNYYCDAQYGSPLWQLTCEMTSAIEKATDCNLDTAYLLLSDIVSVFCDADDTITEVGDVDESLYEQVDNTCMYTHDCVNMLFDTIIMEYANEKIKEGAETIVQAVAMGYCDMLMDAAYAVYDYFDPDTDEYAEYSAPVVQETG